MAGIEDEIPTLDELAIYLKAGKRAVYRLVAEKMTPAFKVGRMWRFRKVDTDSLIAGQSDAMDSGRG